MLQRMKQFLSIILIVTVFFSVALVTVNPAGAATEITDLDQCASFTRSAVEYLVNQGIVEGYNGKFNPTDILTRAQMVKMLVVSMGIDISNAPENPSFADVTPAHWGYSYIEAALREGIISIGSNRIFSPDEQASREQMAAMLVRALGVTQEQLMINQKLDALNALNDANKVSHWAQDSVEFTLDSELMVGVGNGNFGPTFKTERQSAALVIYRYLMSKESLNEFKKEFTKEIQFPELYHAINANVESGRINANMNINISVRDFGTDDEYAEFMTTSNIFMGEFSGNDFRLENEGTVSLLGEMVSVNDNLILKDGKLYYNADGTTTWQEMSPQEISELGLQATSIQDIAPENSGFIRNYNNLPISKESVGTSTIYTIKFDHSNYAQYGLEYIEGFVQNDGESLDELYNNGFEFTYQITLDSDNTIVQEKVLFSGNLLDESILLDMATDMTVDITYSDLGADITIHAPNVN